jgi:putative heavy-metal-binding protein
MDLACLRSNDSTKKGSSNYVNRLSPEERKMAIPLTTGSVARNYEIIDAIFALDSHKEGFLSGAADPGKAFDGVKQQLRNICQELGGHAVINCQFEYRNALADGFMGKKQVIEIFAYGTAVKFV